MYRQGKWVRPFEPHFGPGKVMAQECVVSRASSRNRHCERCKREGWRQGPSCRLLRTFAAMPRMSILRECLVSSRNTSSLGCAVLCSLIQLVRSLHRPSSSNLRRLPCAPSMLEKAIRTSLLVSSATCESFGVGGVISEVCLFLFLMQLVASRQVAVLRLC